MSITFPYVQRGLACPECGDTIYSNSVHDFVECKCGKHFIDGGFDYIRSTMGALNAERTLTGFPPRYFRDEK